MVCDSSRMVGPRDERRLPAVLREAVPGSAEGVTMQVVVTGANGLVGSRCCALLASQGHSVIGLGRGPRRAHGDFAYVTCELSREAEVDAEIAAARPEAIVHTASMTEVDACEKEPEAAFAANVVAAANVARAARRAGAHLIHVSTDYVFDGEHGPYDEEALP